MPQTTIALIVLAACAGAAPRPASPFLEQMTWPEAERALGPDTIVVLPIGAASKEHGPHLRLANDWLMADYLRHRVAARARVVIAPIIGFSYYPAFVEYPGSIHLRLETARDLIVDVVRSLARFGPRRFYALNTGVSTLRALAPAAEALAADGILLTYTDLGRALAPVEKQVAEQAGGTHADEIETSMMLFIAPETVDMSRARRDYTAGGRGPLVRDPSRRGIYSPTGAWGDPTLATRAKGERIVRAFVEALVADIEALRAAPLR
jgi:creatinine amidohydrolase